MFLLILVPQDYLVSPILWNVCLIRSAASSIVGLVPLPTKIPQLGRALMWMGLYMALLMLAKTAMKNVLAVFPSLETSNHGQPSDSMRRALDTFNAFMEEDDDEAVGE